MARRLLPFLACLVFASGVALADNPVVPLEHWVYAAMAQVQDAGLLPDYPTGWIAAGHPLTRNEFAYYIRNAILLLGKDRDPEAPLLLPAALETTLGILIAEFAPELHALGVNVDRWPESEGQASFVDLDNLLPALSHRAEVPPALPPSGAQDESGGLPPVQLDAGDQSAGGENSPLLLPEPPVLTLEGLNLGSNSLIDAAGQVLGVEWQLGLASGAYQTPSPLHLGDYMITSDNAGLQGDFALRFSDQLALNFDALCFVDLDQAQIAMEHLLLGINTELDLNQYLRLFGGLTVNYQLDYTLMGTMGSQLNAGLRFLLTDGLYLVAQYTLADPLTPSAVHMQNTTVGLSLVDIGMFLLGLQTISFVSFESLQLTGEFVYCF